MFDPNVLYFLRAHTDRWGVSQKRCERLLVERYGWTEERAHRFMKDVIDRKLFFVDRDNFVKWIM